MYLLLFHGFILLDAPLFQQLSLVLFKLFFTLKHKVQSIL